MENTPYTLLLPTRPQPDTIVAIFLLTHLGRERFPGIENFTVAIRPTLTPEETFDALLAQRIIALDLSGHELDHHGKKECTSELVARFLGVEKDPSLARMLAYAKRDDKEGKGIISNDPIDRAFGLSGLIASLNKKHPQNPDFIVKTILPLLEAQHASAYEHFVALPKEVAAKKQSGEYEERTLSQKGKKLLMVSIASDKPSMPTYLRSAQGPHADVVVLKSEDANRFCILSRQERKIDLSKVAALIRMREAELRTIALPEDETYLEQTGRIAEIENWYFDPMTNSILNGGIHSTDVLESAIPFEEMQQIVHVGLQLGGTKQAAA